MFKLFSRLRRINGETIIRKISRPARYDLDFYASAWIDELWIRSTLLACAAKGLECRLIISSDRSDWPSEMIAAYTEHGIPITHAPNERQLRELACRTVVTATSGVSRRFFGKTLNHLIHMPHSLVSLHMVYPESAFDEYDVIFSCGPHHEREIRAIASLRGLPQPATHRVGYGRFDLMKTADLQEAENRRVLLAPSWGESNILSVMGTWLISGLLDSNYEVYLRPHPSFFFYKDSSIETLRTTFAGRRFVLEDSTTTPTHSWAASVLISDYSGIGLEYAAHRRRPVVFVDVAKKVLNPNWPALGMEPVEVGLRQELGIIAQPQPSSVINAVTAIAQHERLSRQVIDRYCFQPEHVGACAAQLLAQYVKPG